MEPATIVIAIIIALAVLGIWVLPMMRAWNAGGEDDERRESKEEE